VDYLRKPSTRSTQTPSSWIFGFVVRGERERVSEEVRVTMDEQRRKEAVARPKCLDLGVKSYDAEVRGSALTESTPSYYRH
jgi:hypothetical protein